MFKQKWISVKELLPGEGTAVLVNSQYWSAQPFVARLYRGEWEGEQILSRPDSVTHWMPLPKPPAAQPKAADTNLDADCLHCSHKIYLHYKNKNGNLQCSIKRCHCDNPETPATFEPAFIPESTTLEVPEEKEVYLLGAGHTSPEECPTYYDGCHCTVEVLVHNIKRAEEAEAALAAERLKAESYEAAFNFDAPNDQALRDAMAPVVSALGGSLKGEAAKEILRLRAALAAEGERALEEAAQACESVIDPEWVWNDETCAHDAACERCAIAIRALSRKEPEAQP